MASGKLNFWDVIKLSCIGFFLLVVIVFFAAALVNSLYRGTPNVSVEDSVRNTEPVGKIFYRDN